jgi:Ca2+-binding RTX toxin-like protein
VISGLEGGDTLIGGGGNDQCFGGAGTDTAILPDLLASYAISYDSLTGLLTVSGASSGSDTFSEVEYFQFSDSLRSLEQLLGADLIAPTLNSTNPADNATGVAVNTNLVFTFSEGVKAGSGNIYIYNSDGTVARTIAVNDTTQVNIVGNTVTINPSVDLASGSSFYIRLASGVITDLAGNNFDGINDNSALNFSTINASNLTLTGTTGADTLTGGAGNDTLTGLAGNDTLNGLAGNDILNGGAGTDSMNGGDGSDIYLIGRATEHPAAEIADSGISGTDEVRFTSTIKGTTLTLYAGDTGIEQIVIGTGTGTTAVTTGTKALNVNAALVNNGLSIIGNAGANSMTGTAFADTLDGGAGADILIGGAGADILIGGNGNDILTGGNGTDSFVFNFAANTASNRDTLTDFLFGSDTLQFSKAVFTALGSIGNLTAAEFRSGAGVTGGQDADDHIVYNTTTGVLYYDADGSGAGAAVQVALLGTTTHPALAYTDIQIIA